MGDSRGIQTTSVAFICILAIAVIAVGYLAFGTRVSPSHSTTISSSMTTSATVGEGPTSVATGVSPDGLQLKLMLNSSSMQSHGGISVQIELVNTLNQNVTLSVPPMNQTSIIHAWNGYDYVCWDNPSYSLVDFAVFRGHYSAGNITLAGTPLKESPPFYPPCPSAGLYPGNSTTFLPNGVQTLIPYTTYNYSQPEQSYYHATAELNASTTYCGPTGPPENGINCALGQGLVGYWNSSASVAAGDLNFASPAFTFFPSGEYTIVATDLWNQYIYATLVIL
jgi:hypothetical protein